MSLATAMDAQRESSQARSSLSHPWKERLCSQVGSAAGPRPEQSSRALEQTRSQSRGSGSPQPTRAGALLPARIDGCAAPGSLLAACCGCDDVELEDSAPSFVNLSHWAT